MRVKELLDVRDNCFTIRAFGDSMLPIIYSGDVIMVDTSKMEYKLNDIIVYYTIESGDLKLVAHRIVHIFSNKFMITKGDNNSIADKPIRINKIIGKVIAITERKIENEKKEYS